MLNHYKRLRETKRSDSPILKNRGEIFAETRLQLNHVPVHKTHSAKVRKMKTTSNTKGLARIVCGAAPHNIVPVHKKSSLFFTIKLF